jgi:hypothetical protein
MTGFETLCSTSERIIWNDAAATDDSYSACEKFIGVQPVLTSRVKNLISSRIFYISSHDQNGYFRL